MNESRINELKSITAEVRKDILRMVAIAHCGSYERALADASLLVYLYWEEMLLAPLKTRREDRDRFFTDIAESVPALYAVLARRGFFEREQLWHYRRLGAMLQGLPDYLRTPGIDAPCLNAAPAIAMAAQSALDLSCSLDSPRVIFLASDASLSSEEFSDEIKRIGKFGIPNFITVAVLRGSDASSDGAEKMKKLFESSGWQTVCASSEDFPALESAFASFDYSSRAPKALIILSENKFVFSLPESKEIETSRVIGMGEVDLALEELEVSPSGNS